jgi:recombination protein RecA
MDIRRKDTIKEGSDIVGNRVRVKVVKNKVAPPFKVAEFDIMYGEGISKEGNILDVATKMEIVNKAGSWFSYGEQRLGQGRDAVKKLFKENPELMNEIEAKVREQLNSGVTEVAETVVADEA